MPKRRQNLSRSGGTMPPKRSCTSEVAKLGSSNEDKTDVSTKDDQRSLIVLKQHKQKLTKLREQFLELKANLMEIKQCLFDESSDSVLEPQEAELKESEPREECDIISDDKARLSTKVIPVQASSVGTMVWAKFSKKKKWWPAIIIEGPAAGQPPARLGWTWLMWFGDHRITQIMLSQVQWFGENLLQRAQEKSPKLRHEAVSEALNECATRLQVTLTKESRAQLPEVIQSGIQESESDGDPLAPLQGQILPEEFNAALERIKNASISKEPKQQRKSDIPGKNVPAEKQTIRKSDIPGKNVPGRNVPAEKPSTSKTRSKGFGKQGLTVILGKNAVKTKQRISYTESAGSMRQLTADVPGKDATEEKPSTSKTEITWSSQQGKTDNSESQCLACDLDIVEGKHYSHPLFEGKLCWDCKEKVLEVAFSLDARGYFDHCCVCGNTENLHVCEGNDCARSYCDSCFKKMQIPGQGRKRQSNWQCSLCTPYNKATHGLLKACPDWEQGLIQFFNLEAIKTGLAIDKGSVLKKERGIRVLSLCDGIAAVKLALDQLGVKVEAYYSVDVSKVAREIVEWEQGVSVTHLGDLQHLNKQKLCEIAPIDLVVATRSTMCWKENKDRDFNEAQGLLQKFTLALKQLELVNTSKTHVFWLLESSTFITAECRQNLTKLLQVPPCMWDTQYFAPVMQTKFYWGNLPGLHSSLSYYKERRSCDNLPSYLDADQNREPKVSILRPTAVLGVSKTRAPIEPTQFTHPVIMKGKSSEISVQEMERLMGFPENYTFCQAATQERLQLLAQSSVFVLKHLLKPLKNLYSS